jgi:hypothetical protein
VRTFSKISKVVALVCSLALVSTASAQWPQTTDHHRYSIEFGARAYDRPGTNLDIPLIVEADTLVPLFDAEQATDLGATAGAEIKFNFETRYGNEFEVRSLLAFWRTQIDEIEGPNIDSPFFVDGFIPDTFNYSYDSDFWSIEVMKRQAIRPGLIGILGPRVVSTKDNVFYRATAAIDPGDGSLPVTLAADTDVTATNILIGLQTGFEVNQPITHDFHINGFLRVGGYLNPTQITATNGDSVNGFVTHQLTKNTGSFLGEVGGRGYYYFVPNRAAVYVGYEATWIDGIALAPTQLIFSGIDPTVETANTIFFQAITFGLNFTY